MYGTPLGPCHQLKFLLTCRASVPFSFVTVEFQFLQLTSMYVIFTLLFNYNRQHSLLLLNFETLLFPENTDGIVGEGDGGGRFVHTLSLITEDWRESRKEGESGR